MHSFTAGLGTTRCGTAGLGTAGLGTTRCGTAGWGTASAPAHNRNSFPRERRKCFRSGCVADEAVVG
jgi:hypothetical protein